VKLPFCLNSRRERPQGSPESQQAAPALAPI
jgi:hypothetical protein